MSIRRSAVLALFSAGLALAADPFVGTWKPNIEKSRGGGPKKDKRFHLYEVVENNHYRDTLVDSDGKPVVGPSGSVVTRHLYFDGKVHPWGDGNTSVGERVDERHLKDTLKGAKGGFVEDFVVSADGKTLTITNKGTTVKGGPVDSVLVWEKQ